MPTSSASWTVIDGVSTPADVLCFSVLDVVKPSAPAAMASLTTRFIAEISSADAISWLAPRSPMT